MGRREVRNANLTNAGDPNWEAGNHKGGDGNDEYRGDWEDRPRDVLYGGNENEPPRDLDWEDFGNYGADREVAKYLQNNAEPQGY